MLVVPQAAASAAPLPASEDAGVIRARAAALQSGEPVEVEEERTAYEQTFANPDGTMTTEVAARPQRIRMANGAFVEPDETLVRNLDGSVTTRATSVFLKLSGGGPGELLRIGHGSHSVGLTWPTSLPSPVLGGNIATYSEILPGVDLLVRADLEGVSQLLVVKSREAAELPELQTVRFLLDAQGLTASPGIEGSTTWTDPSGALVFETGRASMWDSTVADQPAAGGSRSAVVADTRRTRPVTRMRAFGSPGRTLRRLTCRWRYRLPSWQWFRTRS